MVETTEVVAAAVEKKTKKTAPAAKKPKVKPSHPPTSEMVTSAIKTLKERGGSSLPAIKKYLAANYKVDVEKLAPFIKRYLKAAVINGALVQTKGKGASGSFKLSKTSSTEKPKVTKKPVEKKTKSTAKKTVQKKESKAKDKPAAKKTTKKAPASPKKVEKKKAVKEAAKTAKKTGEVKAKVTKQKPTKPSKAAPKTKTPKPKTAASPVKKASKSKK